MLFFNLFERCTNRDYRDYRDYRNRLKRRLRLRLSIFLTLLVCLVLAVGLSSVSARVRAQPAQPIEAPPFMSAPIRLQGPDDPVADREVQRLKVLATPARSAPSSRAKGPSSPVAAARSAWLLGLIYLHGAGVTRDPIQASMWFERARVLGEPLSIAGLAWCDIDGCRGSPDPAAARRWIAQLRGIDPARAQYLEWLAESRLSPVHISAPQLGQTSPGSALPARELLVRAAQGGEVNARIELGMESAAAGRLTEAQGYFKAAAPKSAAAAANVAMITERLKSSTSGAPSSMAAADLLASAQRFHRGEGQPANYAEAIRLYRLADTKGSVPAKRMLAMIFSRPTATGDLNVEWMQQLSYLDLSKVAPELGTRTSARMLQREPSPLFDLMPEVWRKRMPSMGR